jgi:hypothetical protein
MTATTLPNAQRGEIAIDLSGVSLVLRPSFTALAQMEQQSGVGLVALAQRFASGQFNLTDCVAVIEAGVRGAGQTPPADLGDRLIQAGLLAVAAKVTAFIEAALMGGVADDARNA